MPGHTESQISNNHTTFLPLFKETKMQMRSIKKHVLLRRKVCFVNKKRSPTNSKMTHFIVNI